MSGMHMLPVYYTTTNNKKRKASKKTQSQLAAEREHEKFLKKMGIGSRSSVGLEQRLLNRGSQVRVLSRAPNQRSYMTLLWQRKKKRSIRELKS